MRRNNLWKRQAALTVAAVLMVSSVTACMNNDRDDSTKPDDTTKTEGTVSTTEASTEDTTKTPVESTEESPETPAETEGELTEEQVAERERFDDFLNMLMLQTMEGNYYYISSFMEHPENFGITMDDTLDYTLASYKVNKEGVEELLQQNKEQWDMLKEFQYSLLSKEQKLAYDKMDYEFAITEDLLKTEDLASPLDIMDGIMSGLGIALYNFPFDDETDVEGYQKMLETIPEMLEDIPVYIQYQIDTYGYEPNDMMISTAIEYSEALRQVENNPLLAGYESKIEEMDLSDAKKQEYIVANEAYVTGTLFPALEAFEDNIRVFDTDTNTTYGLWYYEGGEEYYAVLIRSNVGVDMTAQEMFDYMEAKISESLELYLSLYEKNSLAYTAYISDSYRLPYDIESCEDIFAYLTEAMAEDFPIDLLPEYEVKYLPEALQIDGLGAYYYVGELDDSSPKQIRVNPKVTGSGAGLDLDLTLVHEGIAGHMLQAACSKGNSNCEKMFTELGYSEGWAMYAELTSVEYMGISKAIGKWRAIDEAYGYYLMACLDLGINGLGWTLEDTASYLEDAGITDEDAVQEIYDSMVACPGTYLPYAVGYALTEDLINEYKAAAGDNLNLYEMHRKYMSIGDASFEVVRKYFLEGVK